jgi:hypothetical protein
MAKKLILVDEDMYKSLINQQKDDNKLNLDFIQNNMDKAINNKSKNLSTKNINYQQNLRRYLKARKEQINKPIKAELSNGQKVVLNKNKEDKTTMAVMNDTGDLEEEMEIDSPEINNKEDNDETPKAGRLQSSVDKFLDYLMNAPEKFGISQGGKVLRGDIPIKTSDIGEIVYHLFNKGPGTASPPGFKYFAPKISKDPFFKRLIIEEQKYKETPRRSQSSSFIPSKWQSTKKK